MAVSMVNGDLVSVSEEYKSYPSTDQRITYTRVSGGFYTVSRNAVLLVCDHDRMCVAGIPVTYLVVAGTLVEITTKWVEHNTHVVQKGS